MTLLLTCLIFYLLHRSVFNEIIDSQNYLGKKMCTCFCNSIQDTYSYSFHSYLWSCKVFFRKTCKHPEDTTLVDFLRTSGICHMILVDAPYTYFEDSPVLF